MKRFLVPTDANVRLWRWAFITLLACAYLPDLIHSAIAGLGFFVGSYFERRAQDAVGQHCHQLYEKEQAALNDQLDIDAAQHQDWDNWPLPFEIHRQDDAA